MWSNKATFAISLISWQSSIIHWVYSEDSFYHCTIFFVFAITLCWITWERWNSQSVGKTRCWVLHQATGNWALQLRSWSCIFSTTDCSKLPAWYNHTYCWCNLKLHVRSDAIGFWPFFLNWPLKQIPLENAFSHTRFNPNNANLVVNHNSSY